MKRSILLFFYREINIDINEGRNPKSMKMEETKMKKVFICLLATMLVLAVMASASGKTLEEIKIEETKIKEIVIPEILMEEEHVFNTEEKWYKSACYIIIIGGDRLIDIEVDHHPRFIQAIGEGAQWIGNRCTDGFNAVKGWFVTKDVDE